ncbi:SAF domain-containing protein [Cutibacterium granulosum TM11]|uniref:SAF domain-containing protein n=1 Tax=Cutibacterium granulosum TM11 TaxID=1292373 RepID=A0ACB4UQG3_9ACTN|nr:SAF domain-containing protein [Cutibacterium granulosum TM11]
MLIAVGVLCMCLGGLGGAWAWHQASNTESVLVMTHSVPRGKLVTANDVGVTQASVGEQVKRLPADARDRLVGQHAVVDLPAGSLVSADSVGEAQVQRGTSHVGLTLAPGHVPIEPMPAGTKVRAIEVSEEQPVGDRPTSVPGVVTVEPRSLEASNDVLVDLAVPSESAARLADLSARSRVALIIEEQ